jgi:hypothetical protein
MANRRPTLSDRGPSGTGGANPGAVPNTSSRQNSDNTIVAPSLSRSRCSSVETKVNFTGGPVTGEPVNINRTQTSALYSGGPPDRGPAGSAGPITELGNSGPVGTGGMNFYTVPNTITSLPNNLENPIGFGPDGRITFSGATGPPLPPRLPIPLNSANVTGVSAFTEEVGPQFLTQSRPESRYTV